MLDLLQRARLAAYARQFMILLGCGSRLYRYATNRRAQDASWKTYLAGMCALPSVFVSRGFQAIHRLMLVRIELLCRRIDSLPRQACNVVDGSCL